MIDHSPKQEGPYSSSDHNHNEKEAPSSSNSLASQWLRLKDPRIVRVSRAFGGKDRHSKVCTIRGLRERRVRLSVPTAIQLYDLQDRLGLNQPSKVVDWLLNAAKHEIDELPPLPNINIPPGNNVTLGFPSSMMTMINNEATSNYEKLLNNRGIIQLGEGSSSQNDSSIWESKPREEEMVEEKANWRMMYKSSTNEEEDKQEGSNKEGAFVLGGNNNNNSSSVLLPIKPNHHHHPSFFGLLNTMPIENYQSKTSSGDVLSAHHIGFTNQAADNLHHHHGINFVPFPSTLSLSTGNNNSNPHHQILLCPPPLQGSTTQSYFPSSSHVTSAMEFMDPRQINNHYQMLASSSHQNPSFSLAMMTPRLLHSSNIRESSSHQKEHDFPSK